MNRSEALSILSLGGNPTTQEIKKAYRKLALLHHPDRHSDKENKIQSEHQEIFQKVSQAYEELNKESNNNTFGYRCDDEYQEWLHSFFKSSLRDVFLERLADLFEEASLSSDNIRVFDKMQENDIEMVAYNLRRLLENGCLNHDSFNLTCKHLTWPDKKIYCNNNPYVSKFIFESLVTKENLKIPSECNLHDYDRLVKAFHRLSGRNNGDLGWSPPPYANLITQERLQYLMQHSSVADDLACTITRLAYVDLLTPEHEAFTLSYLSAMGGGMFSTLTYQLIRKNQSKTLEILQQAQMELTWACNREQNVVFRQKCNLKKIENNKEDFLRIRPCHQDNTIDLTVFEQNHDHWFHKEKLFREVRLCVTASIFSIEQLNSFNSNMIHAIKDYSTQIILAVSAGLVTVDDLNRLSSAQQFQGDNYSYIKKFLCDDCITLTKNGLFSIEDVYSFTSPDKLIGYITEQAKKLAAHKELKPSSEVYELDLASSNENRQSDKIDDTIQYKTTNQIKSRNAICKEEFATIINSYKSQSFLSYLSSFWIFSCFSPTRSQTMRELQKLLLLAGNEDLVTLVQIAKAINQGDNKTRRLRLFQDETGPITTGTDEVIVQLTKALKSKV